MASKQPTWKKGLKSSIECLYWGLEKFLIISICCFAKLVEILGALLQWARTKKRVIPTLIIILIVTFIWSLLIPVEHTFEGVLLVKELNFQSSKDNQLFLNSVRRLNQLEIEGQWTLHLKGNFYNESNPKINQANTLTIELLNESSKFIITPTNSQSSEIELEELRLQDKTNIAGLRYNTFESRLALEIKPNDSFDLDLDLGGQPLIFFLKGYRIPELNLEDSPENPNPIELTFSLDNPNLQPIKISHPVKLSINLPNPKEVDPTDWFWGDLAVKDVRFYQITSNSEDEKLTSTILQGKIRMAEQGLKVEPEQFILVEKPGVQKLRHLEIKQPQENKEEVPEEGIEVRFAGKTKRIQVGIDSDFPVDSIQSTWLNQFLPKDFVMAIVSFCFAVVGSLLVWLIQSGNKEGNS